MEINQLLMSLLAGLVGLVKVLVGTILNGYDNRLRRVESNQKDLSKGQEEMKTNYTDKFKEVIQNQNDVKFELTEQQSRVHLELVKQQNIVKEELIKNSNADKQEILGKISALSVAVAGIVVVQNQNNK